MYEPFTTQKTMSKELTAADIMKQKKVSLPDLIKKAEKLFNKFIRERDKGKGCISCTTGPIENACHYYSAGHYPPLRFNEDNTWGGCIACNKWRHGNLIEYRKGLINRIGEARVKQLDMIADSYKRNGWKWDRFYLIEIIQRYEEWK
jgi:hypothetical protein